MIRRYTIICDLHFTNKVKEHEMIQITAIDFHGMLNLFKRKIEGMDVHKWDIRLVSFVPVQKARLILPE